MLTEAFPRGSWVGIHAVEGERWVPLAAAGAAEAAPAEHGSGRPAPAAARRETVVEEAATAGRVSAEGSAAGSWMLSPILVGGNVVGGVEVRAGVPRAFHPADRLLVEAVAERLAEGWKADLGAHGQGPATQAIHTRESLYEGLRPVGFPIVPAATYAFPDLGEMARVVADGKAGYLYSRWGNPTVRSVEAKIRALEGAEEALLFASGMGAIAATLLSLLRQGDTIAASTALYGETLRLLGRFDRWGIRVAWLDPERLARPGDHLPPGTKAVYFEPLVNPTLRIVDPRPIVAACRPRGILTLTDNTFATPHNLRPLDHGVDLVIHSLTKYLSGHGDLTGGSVAGSAARIAEVEPYRRSLGAAMSPFDAFLVARGLKTFGVRMRAHAENAARVAEFLSGHARVRRVLYPGLASHPDLGLAQELLQTPGGMVTFEIQGDQADAEAFVSRLALCRCAASLGGVETLVSLPVWSSHHGLPDTQLAAAGITRSMVRLSIGLEDADDILADLKQALG